MVKNSSSLNQQFYAFLAHPASPRNVQFVICINENVCIKIYFTSEKHFIINYTYNRNIWFYLHNSKNICQQQNLFIPNSHPDIKCKIIKGLNSEPIRIHLISSAIKQAKAADLCKMYFVNKTNIFFQKKKREMFAYNQKLSSQSLSQEEWQLSYEAE